MSAFHDREKIHAQLLRNAARLWGWGENIPDEFTLDPVIRMLLGAVAGESQRVGQEIEASRARVMERLAEVLTPDALTLPLPAHAVAMANPPEPVCHVSEKDVFQYVSNGTEMAFTPAGVFPLLGVQLRFLAMGGKVFHWGNGRRELMFEESGGRRMPERVFWIGLSCIDGLDGLNGLRFFFDWKNQAGKSALLPLLSLVCTVGLPENENWLKPVPSLQVRLRLAVPLICGSSAPMACGLDSRVARRVASASRISGSLTRAWS